MIKSIKKYDFSGLTEDTNKKLVLIIYDIIDNKRRTAMVKLLEGYGRRVQKSAFEALLLVKQYREIILKIQELLDEYDNVRIYRLNSSNDVVLLGTTDTIYEDDVIIV